MGVVLVLAVAIIAGVWGHMAGVGAFGYRLLLHGEGGLYVLNLTEEAHDITVDGGEVVEVAAGGARLIPLVGGRTTIGAVDAEGDHRREWEIEVSQSDVLLNLSPETCLVVAELSGISNAEDLEVEVVERLEEGTEIYQLGSRNIVWPRGYPGAVEQGEERALSVEVVECWLLDDPDFLQEYVSTQIRKRLN